jgi:hypothetical protein
MKCVFRLNPDSHLTRLPSFRPSNGDIFYLRRLLTIKPARSFDELRTHNGVMYRTFQECAAAMGLFAMQSEGEYALTEAVAALRTPREIRLLFIHLLLNDCLDNPANIWETFRHNLCYDYFLDHHGNEVIATELCLQELGRLLEAHGTRLSTYGINEARFYADEVLLEIERWAGDRNVFIDDVENAFERFTFEQRRIFLEFQNAIRENISLCVFLDGKAGRGKTFLIEAIAKYTRSIGKIALVTATSAFAALLYPGGRTTHSAFKVRIEFLFI